MQSSSLSKSTNSMYRRYLLSFDSSSSMRKVKIGLRRTCLVGSPIAPHVNAGLIDTPVDAPHVDAGLIDAPVDAPHLDTGLIDAPHVDASMRQFISYQGYYAERLPAH